MNNPRRKVLNQALDHIEVLRTMVELDSALSTLHLLREMIDRCANEEQKTCDNTPERLRFSTLYEDRTENAKDLYGAVAIIDSMIAGLEDADSFSYHDTRVDIGNIITALRRAIDR